MYRLKISGNFFLILNDSDLTEHSRHPSKDVRYQIYNELLPDPTINLFGLYGQFNTKSNEADSFLFSELLDENGVAFGSVGVLKVFLDDSLGKSSSQSGEALTSENIALETIIDGTSNATTQDPTGLGVSNAIDIEFGSGQGTINDDVMLSALGLITFNKIGLYKVRASATFGRTTTPGIATLIFRAVDGLGDQVGNSIANLASTVSDVRNIEVNAWIDVPVAGFQLKFQLMRDLVGVNAGGLISIAPTIELGNEWTVAPTASLMVSKFKKR